MLRIFSRLPWGSPMAAIFIIEDEKPAYSHSMVEGGLLVMS